MEEDILTLNPDKRLASLTLDEETRATLWRRLIEAIEEYTTKVRNLRIRPELNPEKIRSMLRPLDFDRPLDAVAAVDFVVDSFRQFQTHTTHPRYFGLFDPAPTTMGIAAGALVAAFNPQLTAWIQSPIGVEIEQHLVRAFGEKFGYAASELDGTFTSGGAEANHTAMLTALTLASPRFAQEGLRALEAQPVFYISSEGHHSLVKAARLCGLGTDAVREIPADVNLRMDVDALSMRIARDRAEGFAPFMVVATAGTTNAGAVDPIARIADLAAVESLWLHVDAAWGGAVALVPELRGLLDGIERADSITFDPHKWLSVPRGAGLYLTRHPDILSQTFRVETAYMPSRKTTPLDVVDPFARSIQWSRRFIGLQLFLTLLVAGWEGYAESIRRHLSVGAYLRRTLEKSGWGVANDSALAVVCFFDLIHPEGESAAYLEAIAEEVVASGLAWISTTRIGKAKPVLRACVTNYHTETKDVDTLIQSLGAAREQVAGRVEFSSQNRKAKSP